MPKTLTERKEYEQCPFCDALFEAGELRWIRAGGLSLSKLEEHIYDMHDKVKVRKGTNYKWMDRSQAEKLAAK